MLVGEGTRQDMEYKEELVHNALALTHNSGVSIASKVEDIVLCILMVLVIELQPAMPSNPMANPLHALLKAPNDLFVKQMHILSGELKAEKPWLKLAKYQAQQWN